MSSRIMPSTLEGQIRCSLLQIIRLFLTWPCELLLTSPKSVALNTKLRKLQPRHK